MSSQARRSMSAALKTAELSSEAMEFLREGRPRSADLHSLQRMSEAASQTQDPAAMSGAPEHGDGVSTKRIERIGDANKGREVLVGLSFRVPLEIHRALMHASFERKMAGEEPWTHQAIAGEALKNWLKKHGHM